ncbi:MAG: serine/threonine-protein kinase, partial [Myxococcales bacterium]|nr:serine/threonine-protein kinase [Myxococcales bacterium]
MSASVAPGQSEYCLHCGLSRGRAGGCGDCGPDAPGLEVAPESRCLPPGTHLYHGQYIVGRVLGSGGFGVTYLGIDTRLGMRLAIKELVPHASVVRAGDGKTVSPLTNKEGEFQANLKRFLHEARMLVPFSEHPNIVSVKAFFEDNGTAYLVMPYLDGVTLEQLLSDRGGKLEQGEALPIAIAVMDALRATHARDLLHRDIKPQNVFITREGMVKLIDFGSARQVAGDGNKLTAFVSEGYTPYEQYQSELEQGPPSDVYSLGATLYRMLTGVEPAPAIGRMMEDPVVPPRAAVGAAVSAHVSAAVMKALAVKAADRFQTVEAFEAAISGAEA